MYIASDVFRESYLPREIPGRNRQLRALSSVLEPAIDGRPAGSCWEIGPSGVGKTSTAKYLLRKLRVEWDVDSAYVQCLGKTHWQLLSKVTDQHPSIVAPNNLGVDELRERLESPEQPFIVILDEIGGLEAPEFVTDLAGMEWLSLICIGHDRSQIHEQVPDSADRLRYTDVVDFDPYSDSALFEILDARREEGLDAGVVDDEQLGRIVDQAGGSARVGVQALRSAVDLAIDRHHTTVEAVDIDDCFEHADERIRKQQLQSLSHDHHLVYQILRSEGPLRPQEIYDQYADRAADPSSRQMVVRYRDKLQQYDLIEEDSDGWTVVDAALATPLNDPRVA